MFFKLVKVEKNVDNSMWTIKYYNTIIMKVTNNN